MTLSSEYLAQAIAAAFPASVGALADSFIESNPDLAMLDAPPDLQIVVPAYISWCVRHAADGRDTLVPGYTVTALAEFGRSKDPDIAHLNFKHTCSPPQRAVVANFLRWCLDPDLILRTEQIERALKRWAPEPEGSANAV